MRIRDIGPLICQFRQIGVGDDASLGRHSRVADHGRDVKIFSKQLGHTVREAVADDTLKISANNRSLSDG